MEGGRENGKEERSTKRGFVREEGDNGRPKRWFTASFLKRGLGTFFPSLSLPLFLSISVLLLLLPLYSSFCPISFFFSLIPLLLLFTDPSSFPLFPLYLPFISLHSRLLSFSLPPSSHPIYPPLLSFRPTFFFFFSLILSYHSSSSYPLSPALFTSLSLSLHRSVLSFSLTPLFFILPLLPSLPFFLLYLPCLAFLTFFFLLILRLPFHFFPRFLLPFLSTSIVISFPYTLSYLYIPPSSICFLLLFFLYFFLSR